LTRSGISRILITGAAGQIGSELTPKLRKEYGRENVVASDLREPSGSLTDSGPYKILDVTDKKKMAGIVREYEIDTIFHLAALLSATGEMNPQLAWRVNIGGLYNVLEVARELDLTRVFNPSSIAVFGPETPKALTPQETILRPKTIYGITKVTGELLGDYYFHKYGVDVRGIRFPGVISSVSLPGGGTTDYAVEIFYEAIKHGRYECFVKEDTVLPMIYMPDCLKSMLVLMESDISSLEHHTDFNLAGMSFSAGELAVEIGKHIPEFTVVYKPDYRQEIANTWPKTIDDSIAREEWGWEPDYDLASMTEDMLEKLKVRYDKGNL
jgi:nucleoside-diphosphate-sugar epimerase